MSLVASDSKAKVVGKSEEQLAKSVLALVKLAEHPSIAISVVVKSELLAKSYTILISSKVEAVVSPLTDKTKVTSSKLPAANVSKPVTKDYKAA